MAAVIASTVVMDDFLTPGKHQHSVYQDPDDATAHLDTTAPGNGYCKPTKIQR